MNETRVTQRASLPALESLERASGMVFGGRRGHETLVTEPAASPRAALEALILPALRRRRCLVAFSGGRDSTAVLALATDVARRQGLDQPVPITMRFSDAPRTAETEWQERAVRHLELREWVQLDLTTEFDALGPLARSILKRHGAYWPPLAHTTALLADAAAGGALLTGNGGDEFLSPWHFRRVWLLRHARARPTLRDIKHALLLALPRRARVATWARLYPLHLPWLTPEGHAQLQQLWAEQSSQRFGTWHAWTEWVLQSRYYELGRSIFGALANDANVLLVEPLLEPAFVRALGSVATPAGFATRREATQLLFGDLLPPGTAARETKAVFSEIPWGPEARGFAASWDGAGLDDSLVHADALREEWARETPDFRSLTPLQSAWVGRPTA